MNYVRWPVQSRSTSLVRGPVVLAALEVGGAVSETPTPGGAVAAGVGPVAQVPVPQGGAVAGGVAPAESIAVSWDKVVRAVDHVPPEPGLGSRVYLPTVAALVTETPTPGGAVAAGVGPVAQAPVPQGGAVGAGVAPVAATAVPQGGATAGGVGPVAQVPVPQGGAVAAGTAPVARAPVDVGGAVGAGVGPSPALVGVTAGGATAGGQLTDPGAPVLTFDKIVSAPARVTVEPGLGSRFYLPVLAPVSETPTPGGAVAAGVGPVSRAAQTIGGALGAGVGPTSQAVLTIGGAAAAGVGPVVRVPIGQGGADAGGQLTDPLQVYFVGFFDRPTPGSDMDAGTPAASVYARPTPSSGTDAGEPGATVYDSPSPEKVIA